MDKEFGRVLKAIRLQHNQKQVDMANILGCSPAYLSRIESGG